MSARILLFTCALALGCGARVSQHTSGGTDAGDADACAPVSCTEASRLCEIDADCGPGAVCRVPCCPSRAPLCIAEPDGGTP